ncbi:MAG: hypothetical protein J7L15_06605 [Clostridiales bacterium]|nr:hypothetical protein [Clostridiales bacterium]
MAKYITKKQCDLYNKIIDCFIENPPDKCSKFFIEDEKFFIRLEAEVTNFVISFITRDEKGIWKQDVSGNLLFKEYNEDGEPFYASDDEQIVSRFSLLDLEERNE